MSGCNTNPEIPYNEVSKKDLNKDIQLFLESVKEENGVHLYIDNHHASIFVYLNASNVIQGEEVIHFTGFDVEKINGTLNLSYKSEKTSDYSNSQLKHELIYQLNFDRDYEGAKLFNNGIEISFGTISGNK
ncbi:hypothetical protein [Halobacillus yeomjeoni]|uniref:Uncharacterized protein n=1 Tax=Halobacillus yeomjeoni TaxID=311194 RepID=A0A931HTM5_9BACI|nr:hypothetical protein [Halobacillus yeomjeoni]MBH0229144.1 hypothetical protein [Halobacillus yeomjeoni]